MNIQPHAPRCNAAHHWPARFALRLMELRPDMPLRTAIARGAASYAIAKGLAPEDAAQVDAEVPPTGFDVLITN